MVEEDQRGRRMIITGASSGIGLAAASRLAARGADVVLAVRNPERGRVALERIRTEVPDARVEVGELDLADLGSVRRFVDDQLGRGPLRALINNAGISNTPKRTLTVDGFELQAATNVLGHFVLTAGLMPALHAGGDSRIVSVSSMAALAVPSVDLSFNEHGRYLPALAYAQSKLACGIFALELDRRLKAANRPTISVLTHPGWASTNLFAAHDDPVNRMINYFTGALATPAADGAECEVHAATAAELTGGEYIGPRWISRGKPWIIRPRRLMSDPQTGRRWWQAAERRTGITFELD
ncbi:SDR family NAD(P)-dependent oxidoreductase [Microlunatus sp. Gsoil 973]|jgi:NAD(P)-dependent dehydrogenase (short-subunit alcohol dehydrogenase family)|uniref:SDR family NAD(P)-dependent oxidoreductase n=1 Tax=Microlunatus sp. Gsoil 973 TaxID=2672569 RepID=UPI0012B4F0E2|nr:SDR family NAD(P)-dependent oxidoreductase [Microlunatus sp. Gsoil 973]QGN34835.1 SDR family NAD(P)-dependent oxidoreductase [Microlunatus sp. Gsoil 973]